MMKTSQSISGIMITLVIAALVSLAISQGGLLYQGIPIVLYCVALAFCVQWLAFIPAYIYHTEIYYDLVGGITYISVLALTMTLHFQLSENAAPRAILIALLCGFWAMRLGSFLFLRVLKAGSDARFDKMKFDFWQFLMTWTMQGLWVVVTLSAGLSVMTVGTNGHIDTFAILGAGIWLLGFLVEVIADKQKSQFRAHNKKGFISSGLWSWSRHPNYFGEILLWFGIAIIALPTLEGWRFVALISPVFVFVLLVYISGVRMLENSAKKRWCDDEDYQRYVKNTSVLVPLPPKKD